MYSFKHALTQDVVYTSLLERRRRRFHAAAGRGLEELYAGPPRRGGGAPRVPLRPERRGREGGRLCDPRRREGPAALGQHRGPRPVRERAEAPRRRCRTPNANRLRRIDAVVKQAEVKFALGRHAEHVEALEAHQGPGRRGRRSAAAGDLVLLDRIPAQPGGRPPGRPDRVLPRGARHRRGQPGRRHPAVRRVLSRPRLMAAGDLARRDRDRASARWRRLRSAAMSGGRAGPSGRSARPRITSATGSAASTTGGARSSHGQSVDDLRLKIVGWWRTGSTYIQRGDAEPGVSVLRERAGAVPCRIRRGHDPGRSRLRTGQGR